jgi:hypothetical protein
MAGFPRGRKRESGQALAFLALRFGRVIAPGAPDVRILPFDCRIGSKADLPAALGGRDVALGAIETEIRAMRTMWGAAVTLILTWSGSVAGAAGPAGTPPPEKLPMPAAEKPSAPPSAAAPASNCCATCEQRCQGDCLRKICHWLTYRPGLTLCGGCGGCAGPTPQVYTFFLRPCREGCGTPCAPTTCAKSTGCSSCRK